MIQRMLTEFWGVSGNGDRPVRRAPAPAAAPRASPALVPAASGSQFYIVTNILWMPWKVDLAKLFEGIDVLDDPYIKTMSKKKLKKSYLPNIPERSVLYVTLPPDKCKCSYGRPCKIFQNTSTIEIKMDDKLCSIKIPTNGMIQLTGCVSSAHALRVVARFRELVATVPGCVDYLGLRDHRFTCQNVMNNSKGAIPFNINGDALALQINTDVHFAGVATFQPNNGYSAVNLKIPASVVPEGASITREGLPWERYCLALPEDERTEEAREAYTPPLQEITWEQYLAIIPGAAKDKLIDKLGGKEITFLIFRTGVYIQISPWKESATAVNDMFLAYMASVRSIVEDRAVLRQKKSHNRRKVVRAAAGGRRVVGRRVRAGECLLPQRKTPSPKKVAESISSPKKVAESIAFLDDYMNARGA